MKRFILESTSHLSLADLELAYPHDSVRECDIAPSAFVTEAQERHCEGSGDEIEIDEPASMSEGADGVWIQAWVFVPGMGKEYVGPDLEEEKED